MNKERLKQCPFCGTHGKLSFDDTACYHGAKGDYYIKCSGCRARSGYYETEEEAIAAWNERKGVEE